jgi:hypothetical protein
MRKITREAADAFWAGKLFLRRGNGSTEVSVEGNTVTLLLHGSPIARRSGSRLEISAAGHPTQTTKDRLSGVLRHYACSIWQRNFVWYCTTKVDGFALVSMETGRGRWTLVHPGSDLEQLANCERA